MFTKKQIIFILIVLCIIVYANSIHGEFISDDRTMILENPQIDTGWQHWLFPDEIINSLCFHFNGFKTESYHVANIVLYIVSTILVFYLLRIFFSSDASLIGAGLFAVHPVHTETVAWISGKPYMVICIFVIGGFLLYERATRHAESFSRPHYLGLCVLTVYFMAENYAYFCFFIPLLVWFDIAAGRVRRTWKLWLPLIAYAALVIWWKRGFIGERFTYVVAELHTHETTRNPIFYFVSSMFYHLRLLVWPARLTFCHKPLVYFPGDVTAAILFYSIFAVVLAALWKFARVLFFGFVGFFVCFLAPTYSPIPVASVVAERYLYLPSVFLSMCFAYIYQYGLDDTRPRVRHLLVVLLCSAIIACGIRTVARNEDWKTDAQFWRLTTKISPRSPQARIMLGVAYFREGNDALAYEEFQEALKLNPRDEAIYNNLGVSVQTSNRQYAMSLFRKAIELKPSYADAHYNLGLAYKDLHNFAQALSSFQEAVRYKPTYFKALNNIGNIYALDNKYEKAITYYKRAIAINPRYADAYFNLARLYRQLKDDASARHYGERARDLGYPLPQDFLNFLTRQGDS